MHAATSLAPRSPPGSDAAKTVGGRWELVDRLAEGGMGVVYSARHRKTGKRAAVKLLNGTDPTGHERFRREASVAADVAHPGIVDVYDADVDAGTGRFYIAMELLEGRTLREHFEDETSTPQQLLGFLQQLLEPLAAAHERGFVHRDLKPENVFVCERDGTPQAIKLLDFGIVGQSEQRGLTRTGTCMGTPHYMSPEQATSASEAAAVSDVWSIGVMLYEALAGATPFEGETAHAVVVRACTVQHVPLRDRAPEITSALSDLVDRCLAKDPTGRPANAGELRGALRDALGRASLPRQRTSARAPDDARGEERARDRGRSAKPHQGASLLPRPLVVGSGVVGTMGAVGAATAGFLGLAPVGPVLVLGASAAALALAGAAALRPAHRSLVPRSLRPRRRVVRPQRDAERDTTQPSLRSLRPARGPAKAAATLDFYGDLSCVRTRRIAQWLERLWSQYGDQARIRFNLMPRASWPDAWVVAEALAEAMAQGGDEAFWTLHDRMMVQRRRLTRAVVGELARALGLNMTRLDHALEVRLHRAAVEHQVKHGKKKAGEAPAVAVNGAVFAAERLREKDVRWAIEDAVRAHRTVRRPPTQSTELAATIPEAGLVGLRALIVSFRGARDQPDHVRRDRRAAALRAEKLFARACLPGTDFAELALRFGDDLKDLGMVAVAWLPPEQLRVVSRLTVGQVSEPVESDRGFCILQRYR